MKNTKINIAIKLTKAFMCIVLAFSMCLLAPKKAFALKTAETLSWKSTINAAIGTDGSINITEQKIIDVTPFIEKAKTYKTGTTQSPNIAPKLSPLVWGYKYLPKESDITLGNAQIAILSNADTVIGTWRGFENATYLSKWKGEDSPTAPTFTYNAEDKKMCLYSELTNQDQLTSQQCYEIMVAMTGTNDVNAWASTKAIINMNYTIERAATIFKDVADFQWAYCQDTWMMDSYDVSVRVTIPVGSEGIVNPLAKGANEGSNPESITERNIYAWGHGSTSGIVDLDAAGIVSLNNEVVPGNSDAELRIVFPTAWLTNLDMGSDISQRNQTKLTTILKEESVWRDYRTDAVNKLLLPIIFSVFCFLALGACLIILIVYRRRFLVGALSNKKLKEMHPCMLVRLKNWNHEFAHDVVVSLLSLNEHKHIRIKRMASGDFEIRLKKAQLAKDPYKARNINIIDKRTIKFLFTEIACGNPLLRLSDIENYANARPYEFMSSYLSWHSLLTDEVNEFANFNSIYDRTRHWLFGIAIAIPLLAILLGILFLEAITIVIGIITGIIIGYIGNSLRNKVYFKNSQGKKIDAIDLNIGLSEYTETTDKFRIASIRVLKASVLRAQDLISSWNLENISE